MAANEKSAVKKKILVVDDDPDIAEGLEDRLTVHGYTVVVAVNGLDGVEKASKEKPDLIFMDATMPKMDGWEACKTLKNAEETRAIPLVMLTARSQSIDELQAWESGVDEFMAKPYDSARLMEVVDKFLGASAPA